MCPAIVHHAHGLHVVLSHVLGAQETVVLGAAFSCCTLFLPITANGLGRAHPAQGPARSALAPRFRVLGTTRIEAKTERTQFILPGPLTHGWCRYMFDVMLLQLETRSWTTLSLTPRAAAPC